MTRLREPFRSIKEVHICTSVYMEPHKRFLETVFQDLEAVSELVHSHLNFLGIRIRGVDLGKYKLGTNS